MTDSGASGTGRPIVIAPAPTEISYAHGQDRSSPRATMPYTCQPCARRKVKCDKSVPTCSTCHKGKFECSYQAPPPRKRKRKLNGELNEKLARYEEILEQHGLLPQEPAISAMEEGHSKYSGATPFSEAQASGKLVVHRDKYRYIDNNIWRSLDEDALYRLSEEEDELVDHPAVFGADHSTSDPFTGALLCGSRNLLNLHPNYADALKLWHAHIVNVEPLCKVLHVPSVAKIVDTVSQQPALASKTDECLLFAIYHFAVFSMSDEECLVAFGEQRDVLRSRYHYATRQALVNVSLLKTTEMQVLQAYCLFLLATRLQYDPHTYWILTGTAVRIAQRMGLHRDGEALALPPFDVEMRRRLFYQILPLEGYASTTSGTGIALGTHAWDTKQPLNINDDQIWPGMTEWPEERAGATEMIFFLSRAEIGKFHAKTMETLSTPSDFKDVGDVEKKINEAEAVVEEKYLRYCDIVDPLHFLAMAAARASANAVRLRSRLLRLNERTMSKLDRKELCTLAEKLIDMDTAAYNNPRLRKFMWHIKAFLVHQPLICLLRSIAKVDLLTNDEITAAWDRIEQVYSNHKDILVLKRALHIAIGRLTLKAWEANPPKNLSSSSEPDFITALHLNRKTNSNIRANNGQISSANSDKAASIDPSPTSDANALLGSLDGLSDLSNDFSLDTADWMFWDQLIKNYQEMGEQNDFRLT